MKKKKNRESLNLITPCCNEHVTVIENSPNLTLCLVCKESLGNEDPYNLSTHVLGSSHKENLKKLFKMCNSDYLCDGNDEICEKIISNSVFDLTILMKNETRYIHSYENHIVCLICQDIICEIKSCSDAVKEDIFSHIQGSRHLSNIKQNVCWVYNMETVSGFLMFHQTVMFCSICNQAYKSQEGETLHHAVIHLQTEHPREMNFIACDETEQTQHENFENTESGLLVDPRERSVRACVFGETEGKGNGRSVSIDFLPYETIVKSLQESNIIYGNINQLSTKIELKQKDNSHPFIIPLPNSTSKTTYFCVVCKDIVKDFSGSNANCGIISHLSSPKHEESIEPIIFQCKPDPFCEKSIEKYNELASVLNCETGCVFQCENYLVCLICKKTITKLTQSFETIKYDLAYHFGSKQHLIIMRDNVWWFYYLQFSEVFSDFDNHVSHCTKCASNLESIPHRVVQCFQEHLQADYLKLMERKALELNFQENTSHCNELICSECKKAVNIYNNDPEFSMNLHLESHRNLSEVNSHSNIEVTEETEYTCPVCLEEILIFNKDIKLSVSIHGCSTEEIGSNHSQMTINYNISMVFDCLPDVFKVQQDFIILEEDDFYCKLCSCMFLSPNCFQDACKQVQTHLSESYHKEQYDAYRPESKANQKVDPWDLFNDVDNPNTLSSIMSVIDNNNQYIEKCEHFYFCKVCKCCFLHFGNEQEMMKIFASHFMCKNHKKKLGRYNNYNECNVDHRNDENTCDEINGEFPSQSEATEGKNYNKEIYKLKSLPGYQLNSQFLVVYGNQVYCKLCKLSIPFNKITQVRKHCYGESHSMILAENAAKYIRNHGNKQLVNAEDPCHKKFVDVLKKLAESNYRINNPTITPNLLYIDNNGKNFYCCLCNIPINFSMNGSTVVNHFMKKIHKQMTYSLNCNDCLSGVKQSSFVNQSEMPFAENKSTVFGNDKTVKEEQIVNVGVRVSDFFEKLPKEYSLYKTFISVEGKNVTCTLCSIELLPKNNFEADRKTLQDHLSSLCHKEQYLLYKSSSSDQIMDPWERFEEEYSSETLLEVQQINEKNKEYLEKGKTYFSCSLCGEYFLYFDEENMKNIFAAHCSTRSHVKHLKHKPKNAKKECGFIGNSNICLAGKLDAQSISCHSDGCDMKNDAVKKPKSNVMMILNYLYFRVLENQLFCDICQVFISNTKNQTKKHCYSLNHNIILMKYAVDFVEGLNESNAIRKISRSRSRLTNALKKMVKTYYIQNDYSVVANLLFISYDTKEFLCLLCKKHIKFTENGGSIIGHILSKEHARNVLKLNCIFKFHCEANRVEELEEIVSDSESNISSRLFTSQVVLDQNTAENNETNPDSSEISRVGKCKEIIGVSNSEISSKPTALIVVNQSIAENNEMNPGSSEISRVGKCEEIIGVSNSEISSKPTALIVVNQSIAENNDINSDSGEINGVENFEVIVSDNNSEFNTSSSISSQIVLNQITAENSDMKSDECLVALGTHEHSLEINHTQCEFQTNLIESDEKVVSIHPLKVSPCSSLDKDKNTFKSTKHQEVSELMINDSLSEKTEIKCDNKVSEGSPNDSFLIKGREGCKNHPIEKTINNPFLYDELCYSDSSNMEMKINSTTLTWNHVSIEVSPDTFNENVDYLCPDCNEVITIINKNLKASFEMHFKACHLNIEELLSTHEVLAVNKKFVKELFECIPDALGKHMENVIVKSDTLYCSLCKSFIKTKKRDIFETAVELHLHLISKVHLVSKFLHEPESQLMKQELTQSRSRCQPEVHFFIKDNAPEEEKLNFSNHEILPLEENQSLVKQERKYKSDLDDTLVLHDERSSISEVAEVEHGALEFGANFFRDVYGSENIVENSQKEEDHNVNCSDLSDTNPEGDKGEKQVKHRLGFDTYGQTTTLTYTGKKHFNVEFTEALDKFQLGFCELEVEETHSDMPDKEIFSESSMKDEDEKVSFSDNTTFQSDREENCDELTCYQVTALAHEGARFEESARFVYSFCEHETKERHVCPRNAHEKENFTDISGERDTNDPRDGELNCSQVTATFEHGIEEQDAEILKEPPCTEKSSKIHLPEIDGKTSVSDQEVATPQQVLSPNISPALRRLFETLPEKLMVHQEFLTMNENCVVCQLCSSSFDKDGVKGHIIDFTHRKEFLAELKRKVETDVKSEVKRLMFISSQLYCGLCQCYITPWSDFESICQGVSSHLKVPAHRIVNNSN